MSKADASDVIIVGGGHAGLLTGVALVVAGFSVRVIEPRPLDGPVESGRCIAFLAGSRDIAIRLGVWSDIAPGGWPVHAVELIDSRDGQTVTYAPEDLEASAFGFGYRVGDLRWRLQRALLARAGAEALVAGRLKGFHRDRQGIAVELEDGRTLRAGLLVGADGRGSMVRRLAGIPVSRTAYEQAALSFTVTHERPGRHTVLEVMRPGGPLALLPVGRNCSGVTWVERTAEARRLHDLPAEELGAILEEALDGRLGRIEVPERREFYPLSAQHAGRYVAPRLALVGDAAHGVHPIHAQGFNMGVADVAALVDCLAEARAAGRDPGGPALLAYERARRSANGSRLFMTDGLNRLFADGALPLAPLRRVALGALAGSTLLRRAAIRHGMYLA